MVLICLASLVCFWYMVLSFHLVKLGIFWGFCFYRYKCIMMVLSQQIAERDISITVVTLEWLRQGSNNVD